MESSELITNQFGLGVFEFNSSLTQVFPAAGTEASTDLADGLTAVQGITTPVVVNNGDTDFPDSMTTLASVLTKGGDASSSASRARTCSSSPMAFRTTAPARSAAPWVRSALLPR